MSSSHNQTYHDYSNYDFQIPSFNPSPPESVKSVHHDFELREYNDNKSPNFQSKDEINENRNTKMGFDKKKAQLEQFWQQLYYQQYSTYKSLQNKFNLLQQSVKLHKQALSLRNSESIDNEERVQLANSRIRNLSNKAKQNEQMLKNVSEKCQQAQQNITKTMHSISNEEHMLEQQKKHIQEISQRILSMKKEIEGLQSELQTSQQKQNEYLCILEDNEQLLKHLDSVRNEMALVKLKVDKNIQQQESFGKKMKQLQRIVINREKANRELGKDLVKLRKLNPEANQIRNKRSHNKQKIEDIMKNIKQMETVFSKIQQQIFETDTAMQEASVKLKDKMKSVENLKLRYKASIQQLDESYKSNQKQNKQIFENHSFGTQLSHPSKILQKVPPSEHHSRKLSSHEQNSKPLGYKVIESQQNEQIFYPKQTEPNMSNPHKSQGTSEKKSQRHSNSSRQHSQHNEIEMQGQTGKKRKNLVMTESIKNLLNRYQSIKSNSVFKK